MTYYVRENGRDSNDGKTPVTAFKTIEKAALAAADGDVVIAMHRPLRKVGDTLVEQADN